MRIPLLLSLLTLGAVPVASKLRSNNGFETNQGSRILQDQSTFQSFFDIDYLTNGTAITNLTLAAQALAEAYNGLVKQGYNDPYNRSMDTVDVLDTTTSSGQSSNSDLNAFLRVTGTCNGCPSDSKFTADMRRRHLKDSKKASKKKSKLSSGGKGHYEKIEKPVSSKKSKSKGHSHDHSHHDHSHQAPMVPTEEELRVAYSAVVKRLQIGILDVIRLDEVEEPASSPPYSGSNDEETGSGGYSGKGSVNCPAIGGSFSGTFTSYFSATYELVTDTDDDVPAAVAAITTAYNTVIQRYEADITMEEAFIYDPASGRRLSFEEVDLRRKLQYFRPYYISVNGRCNGCSRSYTFNNQVSGGKKRNLSSWGQCLLPGLPTADELNAEYNVELDRLNLPNVIGCTNLEETAKPTIPEGKGGSHSSTGKSSKTGKGGDQNPKSAKAAKYPKSAKAKDAKSGKRTRR